MIVPKIGTIVPDMGNFVSIADALFSRTQQRLLGLLFGQPQHSFYLKELIERAGMGRGTVQRELARLEASGLVSVKKVGNQKHFQANPSSPVFTELRGLAIKTFGMVDVIREALVPFDKAIECAFIYGSVAKSEDTASSDIDLFVVSESVAYSELMSVLAEAGETLGREINPSIYARQDIRNKIRDKNAFLTRVMEQPKMWVKGSADDIKEFGQPGKG